MASAADDQHHAGRTTIEFEVLCCWHVRGSHVEDDVHCITTIADS